MFCTQAICGGCDVVHQWTEYVVLSVWGDFKNLKVWVGLVSSSEMPVHPDFLKLVEKVKSYARASAGEIDKLPPEEIPVNDAAATFFYKKYGITLPYVSHYVIDTSKAETPVSTTSSTARKQASRGGATLPPTAEGVDEVEYGEVAEQVLALANKKARKVFVPFTLTTKATSLDIFSYRGEGDQVPELHKTRTGSFFTELVIVEPPRHEDDFSWTKFLQKVLVYCSKVSYFRMLRVPQTSAVVMFSVGSESHRLDSYVQPREDLGDGDLRKQRRIFLLGNRAKEVAFLCLY